jgi:hypothetical protein
MNARSLAWRSITVCASLLLASCGGGGGGNAVPVGGGPLPLHAVGGTVSGLQGVVVLRNNGGDDLTVSANGSFQFPTGLTDGTSFAITVSTQPTAPAQTCSVANGTGTMAGADARGATVTCTTNLYYITTAIEGLNQAIPNGEGLVLQNNGGDNNTIYNPGVSDGFYETFNTGLPSGATYRVTVLAQPAGETCSVANGSGTVGSSNVIDIVVTCSLSNTPILSGPCVIGRTETGGSGLNQIPLLRRNGTVVTHATNVTADETWAGDGTVHVIPNPISIVAPATVTIQSCATVELASGAGIDVRGGPPGGSTAKLIAAGTNINTDPIVFHSPDNGIAPVWGRLRALNANSLIELAATWLWGGGNVGGSQLNAVISMNGSGTLPDPTLKVSDIVIISAGTAIYFSDAAFTSDSDTLYISAPDTIIAMPAMALGSLPPHFGSYLTPTEIKVVENANIFDNLTITTVVPIHFQTAGVHVGGLAPTFVPNVTLTLGPGVTLKFEGTGGIPTLVTFGDGGQAQDKNAALIVQGTASFPVTFTSAASSPAPGDWAGLWLRTSNGSQIDHAILEYAGGDAAIGPASCGAIDPNLHQHVRNTAPLIVGDDVDQQYIPPAGLVTNSTFRNNTGSYAIDSVWEAGGFGPVLTATNFFDATPRACTQGKNLIVGGCVVNQVDQSGCLVP